MRDIKFRAWNGQVMEYGGFDIHASEGKIVPYTCLSRVKEGAPLMQYTGLHDKNGKEIYESDRYKYGNETGVIEYIDGCFWCVSDHNKFELFSMVEGVEVTGNVHEAKP